MKIAYLINQYPKVSHSFIRREILALERQGLEIERIALRGWDEVLVDDEDVHERALTRYVLRDGVFSLLLAAAARLAAHPLLFLRATWLALKLGRRAARPWPFHLAYLAEACRILPWMESFGARHLHAHFGSNSAEVAMLAHALGGPPFSFTVHGPEEFDQPIGLHLAHKIRHCDFVVAISSYGRSQLYRWARHADWPKVQVVHCGLEPAFHAVPTSPPAHSQTLVCVGRLCEQKGQLLLVAALGQLVRKGIAVELVLAGDGQLRPAIEQLIVQSNLQAHIRITGWISSEQVRAEMVAARALVLPSFAEGLPVVIMEAMALRRPVICTYVAGIPELVRGGEEGWMFPAGDVDALSAALEQCLAASSEALAAMGESAHRRVLERHAIDAQAAKLAGLFRAHRHAQREATAQVKVLA